MSVKHVVSLGFGFADGTKYIPTLGFESVAAADPRSLLLYGRADVPTLAGRADVPTLAGRDDTALFLSGSR